MLVPVDEPVIYRDEVVALQFTLNDVSATLLQIERLLGEDEENGEEEGMTAERAAERERAFANIERLRALAEKAQAELDAKKQQGS
jgi:hypothetical protein